MGFVPIFMDVAGLPIAVIGGNELAEERVRTLLEAGARVTVISPTLTRPLVRLATGGQVRHLARPVIAGDLRGYALAYCSSDDPDQSQAAVADAHVHGVPINVTDQPQLCRFIVPAVVKQGDLQIAISTSGASPALAQLLRKELAITFGPEYAALLEILRAARLRLRELYPESAPRSRITAQLARDLREALLRHDQPAADGLIQSYLGASLGEIANVTTAGAASGRTSA